MAAGHPQPALSHPPARAPAGKAFRIVPGKRNLDAPHVHGRARREVTVQRVHLNQRFVIREDAEGAEGVDDRERRAIGNGRPRLERHGRARAFGAKTPRLVLVHLRL